MIKFEDYFVYKYAPSFPGPNVPEEYQGLSTSDMRLFIKDKHTNIWYKAWTNSVLNISREFEQYCEDYEDIEKLINLYIKEYYLEKIN
jgi:hypothetical protein